MDLLGFHLNPMWGSLHDVSPPPPLYLQCGKCDMVWGHAIFWHVGTYGSLLVGHHFSLFMDIWRLGSTWIDALW